MNKLVRCGYINSHCRKSYPTSYIYSSKQIEKWLQKKQDVYDLRKILIYQKKEKENSSKLQNYECKTLKSDPFN